MKKLYIFCSKIAVYWIEIPLAALLTLCIIFNGGSENLLKLYPLIILCSLAILFVFIFFFRMIELGFDEIRYVGLFSSRDRAIITEGKRLELMLVRGGKIKVTLVGNDGKAPAFDWVKDSEPLRDICLFRGNMLGGKRTLARILKFYGADETTVRCIFVDIGYEVDLEKVTVGSDMRDDNLLITVKFNETV